MALKPVQPTNADREGASLLVQLALVNPAEARARLTAVFAAARLYMEELEKGDTNADRD